MKKKSNLRWMAFLCGLFITGILHAQQITVTGTVTDATEGFPMQGVSILEKGTSNGTITGPNGSFSLDVDRNAVLVVSFVGYTTREVQVTGPGPYHIELVFNEKALDEVVVIGYGTVRKEDATGSITSIRSDDFNRGAIVTPEELITGKLAGVQITSPGGDPGGAATIRIRGGSSMSASNDPLIVIDGIPVDNAGIAGMRSPLNTIHPNDIETFTVLKDASATAIYGSRASNGVIIITTKKGQKGRPLQVNYDGYVSASVLTSQFEVFSADEFRNLIEERYADNPDAIALLGDASTNWQDEIFQTAVSHDHNLSFSGSAFDLPYRVSLGYSGQKGILLTSGLDRFTGSLNLNPTFFDDHLQVDLSLKGMNIKNRFADWGAIGSAIHFDPTQPVKDPESEYGGYFTWTDVNGNPNKLAPSNPVAMLEMRDDQSTVNRLMAFMQLEYNFHFLPELTANINLGYDGSESEGYVYIPENAPWLYDELNGGGEDRVYTQSKSNELFDLYLNYKNDFGALGRVDFTAGYEWQHFWRQGTTYSENIRGTIVNQDTDYETESYLVSFFGRLNYSLKDRYLLTFTLRNDGSSRFSPETRWGLFPSVAFAWNLFNENFIQNAGIFSELKLRLGYGVTGQQDITSNDYPYLARYTRSEPTARYQFGDEFVYTYRPEGYDANLKWEETITYNAGLDFGFLDNRVTGTLDIYHRETVDLINTIPVPAGTNFTNQITTNVGNLTNRGIEFTINGKPVSKADMYWDIGYNITYNKNEITSLTRVDDPDYKGVFVGGISGGVGNTIQIHSVGYPVYSFFVWEQVYDGNGKPIEGLYVDRDGDGQITVEDRYRLHKAAPDIFMGINSTFVYKNWEFSLAGRANLGNYVYNNVFSNSASYNGLYWPTGYLNNQSKNLLETGFENPKYFSDYYIENGSFFRLDYITLAHNLKGMLNGKMNMRIYGTVQNPLLITGYRGMDPEISSGIDDNLYPRPMIFMLGVNLGF